MSEWAQQIHPSMVTTLTIIGGMVFAIISIIGSYVTKIVRSRAFEASRREIAAFVAEGTISADDAAKLLAAGTSKHG